MLRHSDMHTDGESLAQEKVRKEFSKQTGHAVLIQCRAWQDKHTDQQTVCVNESYLSCYLSYFPTLAPPQIT